MNNEKNNKSSPNKLKEKIKKLRKELSDMQQKIEDSDFLLHKIKKSKNKENNLTIIEDLEQEINFLLKDNARLQEEKLLVLADGENLKKRINIEMAEIKLYSSMIMAEKLLPILDNFERALQITTIISEVKNFLTGFKIIYRMFKTVFEEEKIIEMDTKIGDYFNTNFHVAIEIIETTNIDSGCIVQIMQKGYMIHNRVLRHASVQVAK